MGTKRTDVRTILFRDLEITVVDLANLVGLHPSTLTARLDSGWTVEAAAISAPGNQVRGPTSALWEREHKLQADRLYKLVADYLKKKHSPKKQKNKKVNNRVTKAIKSDGSVNKILADLLVALKEQK